MAINFIQNINGFTGGLNTERTLLNAIPTELRLGSENVEILQDGSSRPRRGVNFLGTSSLSSVYMPEVRTATTATEPYQEVPEAFELELTSNGGNEYRRLCVWQDNQLKFYEINQTGYSTFDSPVETVTLSTLVNDNQLSRLISWSVIDNTLHICGKHLQWHMVNVEDDGSYTATPLEIHIRDFENNVSQSSRVKNTVGGVEIVFECLRNHTSAAANEPGVGATWTYYWEKVRDQPVGATSAWVVTTAYYSNMQVLGPKDMDSAGTLVDVTLGNTDYRPRWLAAFAGRIWIGGFDGPNANKVFYCQSVQENSLAGGPGYQKCHTKADPYSTTDPDPVSTDGGFIVIPEGTVLQGISMGDSLLVGTTRGVYEIRGKDGSFSALEFTCKRVMSEQLPGPRSMLRADQTAVIFSKDNIWQSVGREELPDNNNALAFRCISDNKIQSLYSNIPKLNKGRARPVYHPGERKVYYFVSLENEYFDTVAAQFREPGFFSGALVFDIQKPKLNNRQDEDPPADTAFVVYQYAHTPELGDPYLACAFTSQPVINGYIYVIDESGNYVLDGSGNYVVVQADSATNDSERMYGIALRRVDDGAGNLSIKAAIVEMHQEDVLQDWADYAGFEKDYTARIIMAMVVAGSPIVKKMLRYVYFLFEKVTGSSCLVTKLSDYINKDATTSPKIGAQTEVYQASKTIARGSTLSLSEYDYTWYKMRMLGRGSVHQLVLENTPGQDFHLIGMAYELTPGGKLPNSVQ